MEKRSAKRREYQAAYRVANSERLRKERLADYYKNKDRYKARAAAYYETHQEEVKANQRAYYAAHKEERKAWGEQYRATNKLRVFAAYGGPLCGCCGDTNLEFLTIDHINGGGSKHRRGLRRVGGDALYKELHKEGFPSGYRVLCMNCNWALGIHGYCPHRNLAKNSSK